MPKPWARIEIGYLDHPKFLALNANAICLWHEGKNYCDKFHTDGLIPRDALKLFRFRGQKAIELLTTSCDTPKPDGSAYAPLWEAHPVGFKMHDYLDHNDCRDAVLARLEHANDRREAERAASRERMAKWREAKARKTAERAEDVTDVTRNTGRNSDRNNTRNVTRTLRSISETETETVTTKKDEECSEPSSPPLLAFVTVGVGAKSWSLTQAHIAKWTTAYPGIDILNECRRAHAWLDANKGKRKTAEGMERFLVNWLNRTVERGAGRGASAAGPAIPDANETRRRYLA